jgi:hypothetical protein
MFIVITLGLYLRLEDLLQKGKLPSRTEAPCNTQYYDRNNWLVMFLRTFGRGRPPTAANIAINKGLLFPNVCHKCIMAKDSKKKKVHSRDTLKYTTSDDEGSSSENDDDLSSLFANLTIEQGKANELIKTIKKKDEILECQEDLLVKENKRFVKLKDAFALEDEKCKNLTKELNTCNDSISCLRNENVSLIAKLRN